MYIKTVDMLADRLTKVLLTLKHSAFIKQLNLVNIESFINQNNTKLGNKEEDLTN